MAPRRPLPPAPAALADTAALLAAWDTPGPVVRANMVASADGVAVHAATTDALSGAVDRYAFHLLRAGADVVLVGAGTARRDDYRPVLVRAERRAWREQRGRAPRPRLAVVSRSLDLDPAAAFLHGPSRSLVVTCAASDPARRRALAGVADVVVAGEDDVDLPAALADLRGRGLDRVLCEGGPRLLSGLVAADLLEELFLTVSPLLAGAGPGVLAHPLPAALPLRLLHLLEQDGTLLLRYALERPAAPRVGA